MLEKRSNSQEMFDETDVSSDDNNKESFDLFNRSEEYLEYDNDGGTKSSCLCTLYQHLRVKLLPMQNGELIMTPRKFHRTCSRSLSYHKGKLRCLKIFLLCFVFLFLMTSLVFVLEKSVHISAKYLNVSRPKTMKVQLTKKKIEKLKYLPPQTTQKIPSSTKQRKSSLGDPFNPEAWDNRTANTRKHYVILYWSKIRGHVARLQKKQEYEKDQHVWPYTYVGDKCPISCELTNDRNRAKDADAFVVHSRLTDVWDFPPIEYLAPWILQNNENPVYTPALMNPKIMSKFNLLISYRLDSDFPSPIYPMPSLSEPIPFDQRLGDVLAVFSKCEVVRTEYMRQLMKHIEVHSYGACLKNREGLIGLYGQVNGKYVFKDYKLVLTRFYKFSLVFMNQDCKYFVDDRLYHALETGSIPVYMGTDMIDDFLPGNLKKAIIRVSDFKSPKDLADHLKYLSGNETAFNEYLSWKRNGIGDMNNTIIGRWWKPKYPLFCQVCMRLAQGGLHHGLEVDTCKPRTYDDWNLKPPYGVRDTVVAKKTEKELSNNHESSSSSSDLLFYIIGLLLGVVVLLLSGIKLILKAFMLL